MKRKIVEEKNPASAQQLLADPNNGTNGVELKKMGDSDIIIDTKSNESPSHNNRRCCGSICDDCSAFCTDVKDILMQANCGDRIKKKCTVQNFLNKFPIIKWAPKYRLNDLQGDVIAGLTVGLTVIPQGIAYAIIAGLPPQYGLYSAFMGCLMYMIFGTSKDITLGPTAIMSLLTAQFTAGVPDEFRYVYAIVLTLLSGLIQVLMGFCSLGFLVEFIPYPIINAFTCAAAIIIFCGQIKKLFGIDNLPHTEQFLQSLYELVIRVKQTNYYDLILGVSCMIILFIFKKLKTMKYNNEDVGIGLKIARKIVWIMGTARNALIVILTAGMAAAFFPKDLQPFHLTGDVAKGLPTPRVPSFSVNNQTAMDIVMSLGSGVAIMPIMGIIESIAIGNAFARKNNYRILPNQEFIAIGMANVVSSFFGSYPVTGSFSRTAVNSQSGVRTPGGGLFTAVLVIIAIQFLTPAFFYIPKAALAAVIMMAVIDMVTFYLVKKLWKLKKFDIIGWVMTWILSFIIGIEYGIIAGVLWSLLCLVYPWTRPQVLHRTEEYQNKFSGIVAYDFENIVILELEQGLMFPGMEYVRHKVFSCVINNDPRAVVLIMDHVANYDYSSLQGFVNLAEDVEAENTTLVFSGFKNEIVERLLILMGSKLKYTNTVEEAIHLIHELEENAEQPTHPEEVLLEKGSRSGSRASLNHHNSKVSINPDGGAQPEDV